MGGQQCIRSVKKIVPVREAFRVIAAGSPLEMTVDFSVTLEYCHSDGLEWMFHFPVNQSIPQTGVLLCVMPGVKLSFLFFKKKKNHPWFVS